MDPVWQTPETTLRGRESVLWGLDRNIDHEKGDNTNAATIHFTRSVSLHGHGGHDPTL